MKRIVIAVAAITVAAGVLRLWGIGFGLPQTFTRPDEETVAAVTVRILRSGSADPQFFRYPTLFMYLIAAINRLRFGWGVTPDDPSLFAGARIVAALLGTATVPLLYIAARRLFSTSAALLGAALLAVAFLHVRDSHFGVTDVPAAFMVVAALTLIVFIPESPGWRRWGGVAIAGLACGLAASTKYNAGLILVALIVAVRSLRLSAVGALTAALGFLIGTPYALLARKRFLTDLFAERSHLAGGHGVDVGIGWVEHFVFSLRFGLGVWFLVAAVAGALWLAVRDRRRAAVALAFPLAYYVVMGAGRTVFVRYMTPLVPFAALLAGYALDRCAAGVAERRPRAWLQAATSVVLLVIVGADSARRSVALDRLLARPDSRAIAASFVQARYAGGASIYQTGAGYGHVMLAPQSYPEWPLMFSPRLVFVQTSWLVEYSGVPPTLHDELARGYRLIQRIDVENPASQTVPVFDQQDAFFVPLTGFDRFTRPGPTIDIYERVDGVKAR